MRLKKILTEPVVQAMSSLPVTLSLLEHYQGKLGAHIIRERGLLEDLKCICNLEGPIFGKYGELRSQSRSLYLKFSGVHEQPETGSQTELDVSGYHGACLYACKRTDRETKGYRSREISTNATDRVCTLFGRTSKCGTGTKHPAGSPFGDQNATSLFDGIFGGRGATSLFGKTSTGSTATKHPADSLFGGQNRHNPTRRSRAGVTATKRHNPTRWNRAGSLFSGQKPHKPIEYD